MPTGLDENFPLDFPQKNQSVDDGDTGEGELNPSPFPLWPLDSDEEIPIVIRLSLKQYTALTTAIDVGAAIAYNEDYIQVYWWWVRNFTGDAMDFCAMVAAAINDCEDVRDAIHGVMQNAIGNVPSVQNAFEEWLLADESIAQYIQSVAQNGVEMTLAQIEQPIYQDCDLDKLWASIVAVVEQMDRNNVDFFELLEVSTNVVERAQQIVSAIPGLGLLPFDEVADFANSIFSDIFENYSAQITTALLNEYECDLFCVARDSGACQLRIDDIFNYFSNRLGANLTIENLFAEAIGFLADGSWSGTQIADFMFLFQVSVVRWIQDFIGFDTLALQQAAQIGALEPSDAWNVICDECPDEEPFVNFSRGSGGGGNWSLMILEFEGNVGLNESVWKMSTVFNGFQWSALAFASAEFEMLEYEVLSGTTEDEVPTVGNTGTSMVAYSNGTGAPAVFRIRVRPA